MGSELFTVMSAQYDYRYILVAKMMLKQESFLALLKTLSGDDARSEGLGISFSDDIRLYTSTSEELPFLIRGTGNFVKNSDMPTSITHLHCKSAQSPSEEA